jgi:hypothetical protein
MIRKVIHITLVMFLLITSTGMTIYTHYCGSTFESISVNKTPHSCCGEDCNSCHNKTVTVKIQNEYSATAFIFDFAQYVHIIPVVQQLFVEVPNTHIQLLVVENDLPPPPIQTILSSLQTYRL